jgi:Rieske Fe-S protein
VPDVPDDGSRMRRRGFVKMCASALAAVSAHPQALANGPGPTRRYARVRLVDEEDRPVTPERLTVGKAYVYFYPYLATPCFLIDLGKPAIPEGRLRTERGEHYDWQGGVGPERSVVSFAAICAHRMTHPVHAVSFIDYRHGPARYLDDELEMTEGSQLIYCCSEKSVYDPAQGSRVLGGPAPQPLAAVVLERSPADGGLVATGTQGGEMYDRFFTRFGNRLELEHRTRDIRRPVEGSTRIVPLEAYSRTRMHC